ncbi:glutathione S-transferase family protein [Salinisphaera sp. Q1T1-3]|uniref:glutathione S-transferase family protein n=1 Tax=Salinisphaera sp. Q1T1-3 TaxID=2321229 RepID=UPI000E70BC05|nr:glutathione S-transferase N-terminal domain-containing protein [Salinisphaera sp. Q1T1-3]RJS95297.1 glutathione S-transferase family protein [Salinisphaera sp. Q1T1-3]
MLKLYYHPSPNPAKVALYLEEAGLDYEIVPIDTRKGEQHDPAFLKINPNAKTPALVDTETGATVFDSTAILLYLAERYGRFTLPEDPATRAQALSWLMFIATGIGPYSGQCVHFRHFAPEGNEYGVNRYDFEANRHWQLVDDHLARQTYMAGDEYGLVDIALWGWCGPVPFIMGDDDAWSRFPNIKRLFDEISARPAAERARAAKERHAFKTDFDEESRQALFPQNERLK